MEIFEWHQGCGQKFACFGPVDDFYTVFGTELRFLLPHFIVSLFVSALLTFLIFRVAKKRINLLFVPLAAVIFIILFLLLALLIPIRVLY